MRVPSLCLLSCLLLVAQYDCSTVIKRTFNQTLDHSDETSTTFHQRYFLSDDVTALKSGAPIFFYVGAESSTDWWAVEVFEESVWASMLGGITVAAEHRYFGESLPFGSDSFNNSNLVHLTVEAALADYISIIRSVLDEATESELRSGIVSPARHPVVVFGGSYAGFLSAALRVHYPDVVDISIASAAPIFLYGSVDDSMWFDKVSETFTSRSDGCGAGVSAEFALMWSAYSDTTLRSTLQEKLNLCQDVSSLRDLYLLMYWAKMGFSLVTEFNYPYAHVPTNVAYPVDAVCQQPVGGLNKVVRGLQAAYGSVTDPTRCLSYRASSVAEGHISDTDKWLESVSPPFVTTDVAYYRQPPHDQQLTDPLPIQRVPWNYICCRQFIMPVAGVGIFSVPHPFNFTSFSERCVAKYGASAAGDPDWHRKYMLEPLQTASNIIFSNGGFDPVRGFSSSSDLNSTSHLVAASAPGMAHTYDLFRTRTDDPEDILSLRSHQNEMVTEWLAALALVDSQ